VLAATKLRNFKMKEDERGGACNTHGGYELIQRFVPKIGKEETVSEM
jgi:hypothetical protein